MLKHFLHAFFPEVCMVCKRVLYENEQHLCLFCMHTLPRTDFMTHRENELFLKLYNRIPIQSAQSLFYFHKNNNSQKLLHGIKYVPSPKHAQWFGSWMGKEWNEKSSWKPDLVVPIPLHSKRQRERGYNQSEELARGFFTETGVPILSDALLRKEYRISQTKKQKAQRWSDAENVYEKNEKFDLSGKSILLMDDIITTGSTIEACGNLLFDMNIKELHIYSLSMASL